MTVVYLNQAGTSWPKPECVQQSCGLALNTDVGDWDSTFQAGHEAITKHLGISDPSRLLLTPGCTSALSVAIADQNWKAGDVVITSGCEHHALHRPLQQLVARGVDLHVIPPGADGPFDLKRFANLLKSHTVSLVAVTAASNVTGDLLPIEAIVDLAHAAGALVLVDGAQVVGWLDLDLAHANIDLFAFGGHKGLQTIWGIGGLYVAPHVVMTSPQATCEIVQGQPKACSSIPGYCDVGSVDRIALAGLSASIPWLVGQPDRLQIARRYADQLRQALSERPDCVTYGSKDTQSRMPTVAFNILGATPAEVGSRLRSKGIVAAAGTQCAPLAHEVLGTAPHGVVRLSVGPGNSQAEIDRACAAIVDL